MAKHRKEYTRSEKRKIQQQQTKKRNKKILSLFAISFVLIIAVFYATSMVHTNNDTLESNSLSESNAISDTEISIPLSSISSEASFYNYKSEDGLDIHYFAVIGSDDQVHVAVDACDVCYQEKEGYRQMNDVMECRNCGLTFPITDIGEKNTGGGCWPSFIPISIKDDSVIIETSDLEEKSYMF